MQAVLMCEVYIFAAAVTVHAHAYAMPVLPSE